MNTAFPEPIHYSREDCETGWKIRDWDTANTLLSYFNTNGKSFAIFTKSNGSYFQCAGSKTRLTAEARLYGVSGEYRHYVFGQGALSHKEEKVATTDFHVTVDSTQVLQMRHVRLLLRPWLETDNFPPPFTMTDVTERFSSSQLKT